MNIFTKLFSNTRQKAVTYFKTFFMGADAVYLNWSDDNNSYNENDTVYTVIKKIGSKAGSVPVYVYKPKTEQKVRRYKSIPANQYQRLKLERVKALDEVDVNSNLAKLLQKPNQYQGSDAFFEAVFSFRVYRGEAFIWMNRGGIEGGEPVELYILPPHTVRLVPDPSDPWGILGYIFTINGKDFPIMKEDVIHWKSFNPNFDAVTREHLRGFDPMRPLKRRLQQDTDAMDAAVAMFQNGGAKGIAYNETLDNLTPDQQTQLKGVMDRKVNNKEMKAAVATLQGKWGYLDLGLSSVDMELLKSQDITLQRIAMALGIDPDVLIPGQSFSNKEWAQKKFVTDLIIPLCMQLRDELNRQLATQFRQPGVIDFDFSMMPELQEDYSKMITVYTALFDRGAINGREMRELMGFDPSDNPLHELYLITGTYQPLEDTQMPDEEPLPDQPKYTDYD
jgi:HK97 family phage portal protein